MALNDAQFTALRNAGYQGALPDMFQGWLYSLVGTLIDSPEINDLWKEFLIGQGYEGAVPDMWKHFLLDQGYTDDYPFWKDVADGLIPLPGGGIFDGTYAFYPFGIDAQNKVANGYGYNDGLSPKNFVTTSGIETAEAGSIAVSTKHAVTLNGVTRGVQGALVEPSATNYFRFSAGDSLQNWISRGTGSITQSTELAPDPNYTMNLFSVDFDIQNDVYTLFTFGGASEGDKVAVGVYIKKITEGKITISSPAGGTNYGLWTVDLSLLGEDSEWITANHPAVTVNVPQNLGSTLRGGLLFRAASAQPTQQFYAWGYTQEINGSYIPSQSIIYTQNAPTTPDQDKAYVPTSDKFVDDRFVVGNYTVGDSINGVNVVGYPVVRVTTWLGSPKCKYDDAFRSGNSTAIAGAILKAKNGAILDISSNNVSGTLATTLRNPDNYTPEEIQQAFAYPNEVTLDASSSDYTRTEWEQLRADAGDTPPTEYPDGSFKWLNWPSENVVFEFDFTLLSDDANELFHIEWANAAKDTYIARTANVLEFNHGNDELSVPYANLIETNQTYRGEVIITPTELIGRVEGVADVSITRTDTQLAEWENQCWFGGFEETISPLIISDFKVKDYSAFDPDLWDNADIWSNPEQWPQSRWPQSSQLITSALQSTGLAAYSEGTVGSLLPELITAGGKVKVLITSLSFPLNLPEIALEVDTGYTDDITLSFDGVAYTFVYNGLADRLLSNSQVLFDYLQTNLGAPITLAEFQPSDFADNGDWANNGDWNNG